MPGGDLDRDSLWAGGAQVFRGRREDVFGYLVGNEPEGQLGEGLARDNSLGPLPLESSADSVHLSRGTRPYSFQRGVARLASEFRHSGELPEFGIANVTDPETGAKRTLFLRKTYRDRIIKGFEDRRQTIVNMFLRFDMQPFFVEDGFNADLLTDYFHQYVAA